MNSLNSRHQDSNPGLTDLTASSCREAASLNLPSNYELIFPAAQIDKAVGDLAHAISSHARMIRELSGQDLLALIVREGGIYCGSAVTQKIQESIEIASISAKTYQQGVNQSKATAAKFDFSGLSLEGRDVLFIDDIDDGGGTRLQLSKIAKEMGASSYKFAVLINREGQKVDQPDFIGINYQGPEWFVGFGMDDGGKWRHLPDIYIIKPD